MSANTVQNTDLEHDRFKAACLDGANVSALLAAEISGQVKHRMDHIDDPYEDFKQRLWREIDSLVKRTYREAQAESNGALRAALQKAVDQYGKPGGPWNVPDDPGTWIADARDALAMSSGAHR